MAMIIYTLFLLENTESVEQTDLLWGYSTSISDATGDGIYFIRSSKRISDSKDWSRVKKNQMKALEKDPAVFLHYAWNQLSTAFSPTHNRYVCFRFTHECSKQDNNRTEYTSIRNIQLICISLSPTVLGTDPTCRITVRIKTSPTLCV